MSLSTTFSLQCGRAECPFLSMLECRTVLLNTVQIGSSTKMTFHVCLYDALCLEPYFPLQRQHKKKEVHSGKSQKIE